MTRKVLFLDLDRTLLDTNHFMQSLWTAIATAYNLDYAGQMAQVPHWYRAIGDYRYYDFKLHVEQATGIGAEEVVRTITPVLKKEDFLYPDVGELAKWQHSEYEVRVLSFGPPWVQELKLQFTPAIAGLPRDIILEAKNDFIAREYAGAEGFLVDDKRNPNLPAGFTEVWLDRDNTMQDKPGNIIVINSLTQVQEVL